MKKNVIALEVGDGFLQHRPFPFEGHMAGLGFGGLTAGDRYIAPHCFGSVKVLAEAGEIVMDVYRPRLVGRLNGNIRLFELRIRPAEGTYSLVSHYPSDYKRLVLVATRK